MIFKHNCSSIKKTAKTKNYCTCHILSSLTWVVWIMNFMCPIAVYFWTKNLFLETWRFSHLGVTSSTSFPGTGRIQSAENFPYVSHTNNLKVSLFLWWIGQKTMCNFHISCLGRSDIHYNEYYLNCWQKDILQNLCNMPQNILKFISIHHLAVSGSSEVLNKNGS